jgi:hypothetical protein
MGSSKNWESYSRRKKVSDSRDKPAGTVAIKVVFESLDFYVKNPEKHSGNWVVIPHNWRELSDDELYKFRFAHSRKLCATTRIPFDSKNGDLLFRIRNDVVEMLEINLCSECGFA